MLRDPLAQPSGSGGVEASTPQQPVEQLQQQQHLVEQQQRQQRQPPGGGAVPGAALPTACNLDGPSAAPVQLSCPAEAAEAVEVMLATLRALRQRVQHGQPRGEGQAQPQEKAEQVDRQQGQCQQQQSEWSQQLERQEGQLGDGQGQEDGGAGAAPSARPATISAGEVNSLLT